MPGVLAEVVRGVDDDPRRVHADLHGPAGQPERLVQHVRHDVGIGDAERPGPRLLSPGVRADQAGPELGGDLGQLAIPPAPAVVDQVGAGGAGLPAYLVPERVCAEPYVRVAAPDRGTQAGEPAD